MGFRSNGTKRRRALIGLTLGMAALAAVALPGGDAFAGKPNTGYPKKPVVSDKITITVK